MGHQGKTALPEGLLDRLHAIVGDKGLVHDATAQAPYLHEERGLYQSTAAAVVCPATTEEVAAVVSTCAETGVPMVPQGGNTGLCGGAVTQGEVLISLRRMNRIRALDATNYTLTAEAGCVLADIQNAADKVSCLFPLSLGAEGSCQIGGNLATNAGGINVLRYGNARDLALGLEVVLPDGRVWNGLRALGKDNTGYALRHLFVGGEGTLGIITAAVLKLFPKPVDVQTALCALSDLDHATTLLSRARAISGDAVTAFELIPRIGMDFLTKHIDGARDPLENPYDWYVLLELSSSSPTAPVRAQFEALLEAAFEDGLLADAVIAESAQQAKDLWRLRESLPEAQKFEGGSIKHDVAVPVSHVTRFIGEAMAAVTKAMPGIRPVPFGHVGDGNIHFNLSQPPGMDRQAYLEHWGSMNRIVHDIVMGMGGSFSAEHGIGALKVDEMVHYKDPVELDLMRALKRAVDPQGLMNPGKVVRAN